MKGTMLIFRKTIIVTIASRSLSQAFLPPAPQTPYRSVKQLFAGQESSNNNNNNNNEGLVAMGSDLQSQLASAFSALDEGDQYDAVLTGLCAKILDQPTLAGDLVIDALKDPISLLEEMNSRRVSAGSRSLMALVDVSTYTQTVAI